MTEKETTALLAMAQRNYGATIDRDTIAMWAHFLVDVSVEEGTAALEAHICECAFFPKIADLRRRVAAARVGPADVSTWWAEVRRAIRTFGRDAEPAWSNGAIACAVRGLGWRELCLGDEARVDTRFAQFRDLALAYHAQAEKTANVGALQAQHELRRLGSDGPTHPLVLRLAAAKQGKL